MESRLRRPLDQAGIRFGELSLGLSRHRRPAWRARKSAARRRAGVRPRRTVRLPPRAAASRRWRAPRRLDPRQDRAAARLVITGDIAQPRGAAPAAAPVSQGRRSSASVRRFLARQRPRTSDRRRRTMMAFVERPCASGGCWLRPRGGHHHQRMAAAISASAEHAARSMKHLRYADRHEPLAASVNAVDPLRRNKGRQPARRSPPIMSYRRGAARRDEMRDTDARPANHPATHPQVHGERVVLAPRVTTRGARPGRINATSWLGWRCSAR